MKLDWRLEPESSRENAAEGEMRIGWMYLFQLLFLLMQSLGCLLRSRGETLSLKDCLLALLLAALAALPVSLGMMKLIRTRFVRRLLHGERQEKQLPFLVILLVLLFAWLPCYLAFYPGILAYDVTDQWIEFSSRSFRTHHPLVHTLMMCGIFQLGETLSGDYNTGVAIYSALQLTALAVSVAYCLFSLRKLLLPQWLFWLVFSFFALFPLLPLLGLSSTKDIFFSVFFLTSFCLLIEYLETGKSSVLIRFSVFLMLSLLFRNNAIYSTGLMVLVFVVALLARFGDRKFMKRLIAGCLAAILLAYAILGALQKTTQAADGSPAEMLSVPVQQIARVYQENWNELSEEDLNEIYTWIYFKNIGKYRQEISDPVKSGFNKEYFKEAPMDFVRLWISLGLRFPLTYVKAFLYNTMPLWDLQDESLRTIKGCYLEMDFRAPAGTNAHPDSKLPKLESGYRSLMQQGTVLNIPILSQLGSPAVYTWLIFYCLALLLTLGKENQTILPFMLLAYLATLLLGPCILPRYCFPAFLCTPPLLCYMVHMGNKKT